MIGYNNKIINLLIKHFLQKRYKALTKFNSDQTKINYMFYRQNNAINNDSI